MKKITTILAFLAMLFTSCSRMVNVDYKVADYGVITAIHSNQNTLSIHSLKEKKDKTWLLEDAEVDYLSAFGLSHRVLAVKDTVYVYQDGSKFFASKHSIEDAKSINQAIDKYENKTLPQFWPVVIIMLVLFTIIAHRIQKGFLSTREFLTYIMFSMIMYSVFVMLAHKKFGRLEPLQKGIITQITPEFVTLDNSMTAPLALTEDIKTEKTAKIGQEVYLYEANNHVFISSLELNENTLKMPQPYPETWFCILLVYLAIIGTSVLLSHFIIRLVK